MLERFITREGVEANYNRGLNQDGSVTVLDSFDLFVDPVDQSVAECLTRDGYWESWITSWFAAEIEGDWTCLDIGANFGYYTGVMNKLAPLGTIHAFEPNPSIYMSLARSRELNGWDRVTTHHVALGAVEGRGVLTLNDHLQGSGSLLYGADFFEEFGNNVKVYDVEVRTLDSYNLKPHIVKMDVEGFEPAVFEGGSETLAHAEVIVVEVTAGHPAEFFDMIFREYDVYEIQVTGMEAPITRHEIEIKQDWTMLVLRRK